MLTPLPFLERTLCLAQLPRLNGAVLVVKAEVAAGEPPFDRSTQRRSLTPAVRVAVAFVIVRVVDSLKKRSLHSGSVARLRGERNCPRSGERLREPSEHGEVGMKLDALKPTYAERSQPVLVLESTEFALDARAAPIEVAPRFASRGTSGCRRDALIHLDFREHSPVGQRHLPAPRLESDPANVQRPCSHSGARWSPRLTAGVRRSCAFR